MTKVCQAANKDAPSRHDTDWHVSSNMQLGMIDDNNDVYPVFMVDTQEKGKNDPYHVEMDIIKWEEFQNEDRHWRGSDNLEWRHYLTSRKKANR